MALRACANKPLILVDGGPWYPWALERLGLQWLHVTFGERNGIEHCFGMPEGLPLQLERQGQGPIGRGGDGPDPSRPEGSIKP